MDIVMLALARWDGPYSSTAFSLAKEFSKSNRVFYVENPITLKYFLSNILKRHVWRRIRALLFGSSLYALPDLQNPNLIAVTPQLTIPINFLPNGSLYKRLTIINDLILGRALTKLTKDYSVDRFIFFNCFNPFYSRKFPRGFNPSIFIYMTVDDIRHSTHIKKHGPRLEIEMMKQADIVLTTSSELKVLASQYSKYVYHLPNAADISLFRSGYTQSLPLPTELEDIKPPIVIYTGNIDHRLDFGLLNELVIRNPAVTFVLVGPISIDESELRILRKNPNVSFTGKKTLNELPAFLKHVHCAIIPFKCNALTKSIYPLKINEYLATGKPVISTPFSNDIQSFSDVISIEASPVLFSDAMRKSIEDDSTSLISERLRFVENNTWKARVDSFWLIVNEYLKKS